jgi:hypothetical protein
MVPNASSLHSQGQVAGALNSQATMRLYPITRSISREEADVFLHQTQEAGNYLGSGFNGDVYRVYSKDKPLAGKKSLALKVHRGNEARANKNKYQEIEKLKLLNNLFNHYGKKLFGISQVGIAAFNVPGENAHILTTFVPGHNPNPLQHPYTKASLQNLIKQIVLLDQGTPALGRFMHYDLSNKNININLGKAGIFDWEYLTNIRFDNNLKLSLKGTNHSHCNVSDTCSFMPSNIRNFEFRSLHHYLSKQAAQNPKAAREFFEIYLQQKADYHKAMQRHYRRMKEKPPWDLKINRNLYETKLKDIIESENTHALLLTVANGKTPVDIQRAELIKLELCYYTFITGGACADGKFNGKQVGEAYDRGKRFFADQLEKAKKYGDKNRQRYYQNCLMVLDVLNPFLNSGTGDNQKSVRERRLTDPLQPDLLQLLYGDISKSS